MKIFTKLLLVKRSNKGFTLIELIAASIMTLFIVGAAGFSMIVMLREQTIATAGSDIQYNLNRAVDFIAEEIKQASGVTTSVTIPSGCVGQGTNTVVLGLTIPPGTTTNVIYYTKTDNTTTPPNSGWLGPSVIYRCGPTFDASGAINYSGSLSAEPLVDAIALNNNSNTCLNGGSPNPSNNSGFFVCITNNRLVEIQATASAVGDQKVENLVGTTPDQSTRFGDKATYSATTQVYARSKMNIPITVASGNATFSSTVPVEGKFATTSCASTFFPIDIAGTATNITANGTITAVLSGTSLALTPAAGTFTVASTSSTNTVNFTSGSCIVTATLTTP